jgi:hypothetical protein
MQEIEQALIMINTKIISLLMIALMYLSRGALLQL